MLEHDDRKHTAAELIGSFPCLVELPDDLRNNFEKHGVMPFNENDRRRYPRVLCRSKRNRAGLEYRTTIPQLPRETPGTTCTLPMCRAMASDCCTASRCIRARTCGYCCLMGNWRRSKSSTAAGWGHAVSKWGPKCFPAATRRPQQ